MTQPGSISAWNPRNLKINNMKYLNEPEQPSPKDWKFIEELSSPVNWHFNWTRTASKKNEADLSSGVEISNCFPDNNLETAFEDLNSFFTAAKISIDGKYRISIKKADSACFEAYRLDIKSDSCTIQANDSEGVRRAVYYLEDLLLSSDGPFLKLSVIKRKPWLKSRISRCFFGPIKRPPLNRDELLDDVDYYPDEYLNRLAHEGINGLWLTISFSDLCKTSITDLAPDAEKRLTKLRGTVAKCLRYGIKTYIFCIEPHAMASDELVKIQCTKPDKNRNFFCPFSDIAQKYLYESTNWIFSQVPGLGGMINISHGERPTTCASVSFDKACPVFPEKTPGDVIAATLEPMAKGIHDAAPNAELISWLYVPDNNPGGAKAPSQLLDIAEKLPKNIILQYNFESGGSKKQLGKERHAGDYWLSYVGPSEKFKNITRKAQDYGKEVSAKIQVGCSHEVATVPLVPVPGLLYRKYKAMHELGVSHVMQCWFFGNYPGIMNKAAGELAFEDFTDSEEDFLRRLATPEWGKDACQVVKAWRLFTDAYSNYPLDNMFQYYGPMHDGVVWPLYLKPVDEPLAPTWKLEYGTSGDRYGECLGAFALKEVLSLCEELSNKWHNGLEILQKLPAVSKERREDIALAKTLDIQFCSGLNILRFYELRDRLLQKNGKDGLNILSRMREIVLAEITNSTCLIELCKADSRFGFHPEAEGYKYFPEKLKWRIKLLNSLLEEDFPEIQKRLNSEESAFVEKHSKSYNCNSGKYEQTPDFAWKASYKPGKLKISINNYAKTKGEEFRIFLEAKPFHPPQHILLKNINEIEIPLDAESSKVGFNIFKTNKTDSGSYNGWQTFHPMNSRLVLGDYNPHNKGKLILVKE